MSIKTINWLEKKYFTGDACKRDNKGYYRIIGRVDDVINVSGHRLGTAEIENAINLHDKVVESAVIGFKHKIKGQGIYAYVTLMEGVASNDELLAELRQWVRKEIGPIAAPDWIQWAPNLPKTRSGKIMRRIVLKIAARCFLFIRTFCRNFYQIPIAIHIFSRKYHF